LFLLPTSKIDGAGEGVIMTNTHGHFDGGVEGGRLIGRQSMPTAVWRIPVFSPGYGRQPSILSVFRSLQEGQSMRFNVVKGPKGWQAENVEEGNSLRATSRKAGVSINTITKLLVDVGAAAAQYHDENIRNVRVRRLQCDEMWSFVGAKK